MKNFLSCIHKDIKTFGRSKLSGIVAVVIPLLIALLVSSTFSMNELQGVQVGVYSDSYNDLTNSIINGFKEESFIPIIEKSKDECIDSVKSGKNQICVVFPSDLSNEGNAENVLFYVDSSRMNIAYVLINDVKTQIGTKSSEISIELVEDLITRIKSAKEGIGSNRAAIISASSDLTSIENSASNIVNSVPNTTAVLNMLLEAKDSADLMNSTEQTFLDVKKGINEAIKEIRDMDSSFDSVSGGIGSLETDSSKARGKLDTVTLSLESILNDLNAVRVSEAEKIVSPISVEIHNVIDESKNWNYIFPTILALMILFASIVLASVMALREKQTRAYFRNFITPTSDLTFILAMYVSAILILLVQAIVLFSGLALATDLPIMDVIGRVSLILLVSATAFIFLGIFVGHFFRSEEVVILVSLSIICLMMFFSNTIVPIESIMGEYQKFVMYNPLVISSSLLKRVILFDAPFGELIGGLLIIAGMAVAFLVMAFSARKATKRFV